jgi:hypothetical protein
MVTLALAGRNRHIECIGLNHHFVNVVALGALKRVQIEPQVSGHDASEHHASMAL